MKESACNELEKVQGHMSCWKDGWHHRQGRLNLLSLRWLVASVTCTAVILFAIAHLAKQSFTPSPISSEVNRVQKTVGLNIIAKLVALIEPMLPNLAEKDYARVMSELDKLLRSFMEDADEKTLYKLCILYGYLGMRLRASECFKGLLQRLGGKENRETRLLGVLVSGKRVSPQSVNQIERSIEALQLGWFEKLAKAWLYEKAFMFARANELRQEIHQSALRGLIPLFGILVVLLVVGILGVILTPFITYLLCRDIKRKGGQVRAIDPLLLFEAFAVYLAVVGVAAPVLAQQIALKTSKTFEAMFATALILNQTLTALTLLWLVFLLRSNQSSLSSIGWHANNVGSELAFGLGAYICIMPWAWLLSLLSFLLSRSLSGVLQEPIHPVAQAVVLRSSPMLILAVFVAGVLIAPTVEETFFRGVLYSVLRQRIGILPSAALSALLFAILHPQSLLGIPPLFIIGLWLSLLYEARMSIVGCIFAHALINLNSLTLLTFFIMLR